MDCLQIVAEFDWDMDDLEVIDFILALMFCSWYCSCNNFWIRSVQEFVESYVTEEIITVEEKPSFKVFSFFLTLVHMTNINLVDQ